jgi:imidazolonepropionase-like amidohydrolase
MKDLMSPSRLLPAILPCCLIFAVACSQEASSPQAGSGATWFEGARLIVGDASAPVENSAFLVEGDTIAWVGQKGERQPPEGAQRVDLSGKTVIPALIDGHNHNGLFNIRDGSNSKANYTRENLVDQLERCAYYGVGATLSMGLEADPEIAYRLRDEVVPDAARFLTVGKGIAATSMGGPPTEARLGIPYGAATEEEGRKHVQALHARGVKFVKIWVDDREGTVPKLKPNVYRAIINEAHANGQQVLAHLGRTSALEDAKDLFRAGIDGFVHTVRDRDVDEEYLALVKAHPNVWTGPNMPSAGVTEDDVSSLAETMPADQIERMREGIERGKASGNTGPSELFQLHCRNLRKIHGAGMTIALGTDGTGDGFGVHQQLASYTRCGMTPGEAIVAATGTNAKVLGLDKIGTVAAGREAGFVVLDANPLDDILNTRRISRVYLRGKEVDRKGLRGKLTGANGGPRPKSSS